MMVMENVTRFSPWILKLVRLKWYQQVMVLQHVHFLNTQKMIRLFMQAHITLQNLAHQNQILVGAMYGSFTNRMTFFALT